MSFVPFLAAVALVGYLIVAAANVRRPARIALVLAILIVAIGLVASVVSVVGGVDDRTIEYSGRLDVDALKNALGRPAAGLAPGAQLVRAEGVAEDPAAGDALIALWAFSQLAPWLLAAFTLALLAPLLRAADRGEPFSYVASRRLRVVGTVLLLGIPGVGVLDFVVDEAGSGGLSYGIALEPHLTVTFVQFLPGLLVLVLAGVFGRGATLQDLERHTV